MGDASFLTLLAVPKGLTDSGAFMVGPRLKCGHADLRDCISNSLRLVSEVLINPFLAFGSGAVIERRRRYSPLMKCIKFCASLATLIALALPAKAAAPVTIFAAASTQQAVETVIAACPLLAGTECRGVYAASSTLARQIDSGAPADLFVSANLKWMDHLQAHGRIVDASRHVIAANRLVAIAPDNDDVAIVSQDALIAWFGRDRIALGDPAHVPAGIYAKQTLTALGAWETLRSRVVAMPNVRAALAVVARGEASAGIVYATDARVTKDVRVVFTFAENLHVPIRYPLALIKDRDGAAARRVYALFLSDTGWNAFKAAGFQVETGQ